MTHEAPIGCPPARILLAEDDGEFRSLVALKLRDAGFDVTEVVDGEDLLDRMAEGCSPGATLAPFDMVLADIQMPHFSAFDVMVGARSCLETTPVVLMTAFGDADTHQRARRLGATAVLDKPFQLDDLSATLLRIMIAPKSRSS